MAYAALPIADAEIQQYIKERVKVNPNSGCWEWNAYRNPKGYGLVVPKTRACKHTDTTLAHRISCIVFNGPVANSDHVRHRCNNKSCCNPDHLVAGTAWDNMQDKKQPLNEMITASLYVMQARHQTKLDLVNAELAKRLEDA